MTKHGLSYYTEIRWRESERTMAKKIVNIRLRPDQEERINAIVERSAILDTSKFVQIAVDWLLRSDIGEVIRTIVGDGASPDYTNSQKTRLARCRATVAFNSFTVRCSLRNSLSNIAFTAS